MLPMMSEKRNVITPADIQSKPCEGVISGRHYCEKYFLEYNSLQELRYVKLFAFSKSSINTAKEQRFPKYYTLGIRLKAE